MPCVHVVCAWRACLLPPPLCHFFDPVLVQASTLATRLPFVSLAGVQFNTQPVTSLTTKSLTAGVCDIACRTCAFNSVSGCTSCGPGLFLNGVKSNPPGAVGPCVPLPGGGGGTDSVAASPSASPGRGSGGGAGRSSATLPAAIGATIGVVAIVVAAVLAVLWKRRRGQGVGGRSSQTPRAGSGPVMSPPGAWTSAAVPDGGSGTAVDAAATVAGLDGTPVDAAGQSDMRVAPLGTGDGVMDPGTPQFSAVDEVQAWDQGPSRGTGPSGYDTPMGSLRGSALSQAGSATVHSPRARLPVSRMHVSPRISASPVPSPNPRYVPSPGPSTAVPGLMSGQQQLPPGG
jgi:hypothetical protein